MSVARANGLRGMGGECGELAVAMNRVLFDGNAEIVAGLNTAFLQRDYLIGHFAVQIPFGPDEVCVFDVAGEPISYDSLESWGMLDPHDSDYADRAKELGVDFGDAEAEGVEVLIFDSEEDVLTNMPGSGLDVKVNILHQAMRQLGYVDLPSVEVVGEDEEGESQSPSM